MNRTSSERVRMVEVGPRDGLQNESQPVATGTKVELIARLRAAGLKTIEATSFVSPKWIPQLADAAAVIAALDLDAGVDYPVLVPNVEGYARASAARVRTIAVFTAASEAFTRKNINASIDESLARIAAIAGLARADGVRVRGYVSTVLGCPYQGAVPIDDAVRVSRALVDLGCYEVSLGDTIGAGTARGVRELIDAVSSELPLDRLAVHFHDTRGQALANVLAALDRGVRTIDASIAGLGGCPYATGASGNVATEDVVYLLDGLGVESGVDLDRLIDAGRWISETLCRVNGSKVGRAGNWPKAA